MVGSADADTVERTRYGTTTGQGTADSSGTRRHPPELEGDVEAAEEVTAEHERVLRRVDGVDPPGGDQQRLAGPHTQPTAGVHL